MKKVLSFTFSALIAATYLVGCGDNAALYREQSQIIAEKLAHANEQAEAISKKFHSYFGDYEDEFMPDILKGSAIYSNIEEKYSPSVLDDLTKELSEEFGGYWIMEMTIEQSNYEGSPYDSPFLYNNNVYWAESPEDIYVGSDAVYNSYNYNTKSVEEVRGKDKTSPDGLKGYLHEYNTDFITGSQWYEKYEDEWNKEYNEQLESRREQLSNKRFTEDRELKNIIYSSDAVIDEDNFKSYSDDRFSISNLKAEMVDSKIYITGTFNNLMDIRKDFSFNIEVLNPLGERKDTLVCNVGDVAGQASEEFSFVATPNCADQLQYYYLTRIYF